MKFTYTPAVFDMPDIEMAKKIILTPEAGLTTEQRWAMETPWLHKRIQFEDRGLIVDYGCGIGRMAKLYQQPVVGVDISFNMRFQAEQYVERPSFFALTPVAFDIAIQAGMRAHGAMCIWALQHMLAPEMAIGQLAAALYPGSPLYVVNRIHRAIPVHDGQSFTWVSDGVDVFTLLELAFALDTQEPMPKDLCAEGAVIQRWIRRGDGA